MSTYIITGEPFGTRAQVSPYSLVANANLGVGQKITLSLSAQDEATLIGAGILALYPGDGTYRGSWQPNRAYLQNDVVLQAGALYEANVDFTSGSSFNAANWTQLSGSGGSGSSVVTGPGGTAGANTGSAITIASPVSTFGTYWGVANAATVTVTLPAPTAGAAFDLRLDQDATGGRKIVFTGATVNFPGGAFVPNTAASAENRIRFRSVGTTAWEAIPDTNPTQPLNAVKAGYLVQGSAADQTTGMTNFLNAVAAGGGIGYIPAGNYHFSQAGGSTFVLPAGVRCIYGDDDGNWSYLLPPNNSGTNLFFDTDTANAPETTAAFTVGPQQTLRKLTIRGPATFSTSTNGVRPAAMAGVNLLGSGNLDRLNITQFGAMITIGGPGVQGDHWNIEKIGGSGGFGIYGRASTGGGDVHMGDLRIQALMGAIVQDAGAAIFQGGYIKGAGLYAPYPFLRWDDGTSVGGTWMAAMDFVGVNCESPGNGVLYDEKYNVAGQGGSLNGLRFFSGQLGNIQAGGFRWTNTWTPGALTWSAGTPNQITVQVPAGGFVFRKNGAISDVGGNIPAGTTVTAVTGTWPNGVSGAGATAQYTLTLSNSLSLAPSGALTYTAPIVGKTVASSATNLILPGPVSSGVFPLIVATSAKNLWSNDGTDIASAATGPGIFQYTPGLNAGEISGVQFGTVGAGATRYTTLPVPGGTSVAEFDVVEQIVWTANANFPAAQTAAGTGMRVLGIAQRAVSGGAGGAALDILVEADTAVVVNKGSAAIASGTLLKVDPTNGGGVAAALNASDGQIIGKSLISIPNMARPQGVSATAVGSGGTFAAGTYFWQVTATNATGETIGSAEASATLVLNGSCNLAWSAVTGATGYKVYRSTFSGGEATTASSLVTTIGSGATVTYTDTGTALTTGKTTLFNATVAPASGAQTIAKVQANGVDATKRPILDFEAGAGITVASTDDSANNRTKVTVTNSASGAPASSGWPTVATSSVLGTWQSVTMEPASLPAGNTGALVAGIAYYVRFYLAPSVTLGTIDFVTNGAGATLTANQCQVGLYADNAGLPGTLVGLNSDTSGSFGAANTHYAIALTVQGGQTLARGAEYLWVGVLFNGTTIPTLVGSTLGSVVQTQLGINAATAGTRWCKSTSSVLTALQAPASGFSASSVSGFFCGIR